MKKRILALTLTLVLFASLLPLAAYGAVQYAPGDVNGDNKRNALDVVYMLRYINGQNVTLARDADVTGDGAVDLADAIRFMKYLVGYDVELVCLSDTAADQDDDGHPNKNKDDDPIIVPDDSNTNGQEGGPDNHYQMGPGDDTGANTGSNTSSGNSGSNNGSGSTTTPATPAPTPVHTHSWKPVYGTRESTMYTTEKQITGYTDGDPIYGTEQVWVGCWTVCNGCGQKFATGNEWNDHCAYMIDTYDDWGHGSYHRDDRYETKTVITGYEQVPVYSEVQVPHTFTEECIDHYECACGATKPNE